MRTLVGFILAVLGILFLGSNLGWWDSSVVNQLWGLWPLLIILLGISLLIKNKVIVGVIALSLVLVVAWAAAAGKIHTNTFQSSHDWSASWGIGSNEQGTFRQELPSAGLTGFTINIGGNNNITLKGSDDQKITADLTGPKQITEGLKLAQTGDKALLSQSSNRNFSWPNMQELRGTITMPKALYLELKLSGLTRIEASNMSNSTKIDGSGSSAVHFVNSTTEDPTINISGASRVELDQCNGSLSIDASGASAVTANSCTLSQVKADLSGSSSTDIASGSVIDSTITVSGASKANVPKPSGQATIDTSGASKVEYR